ncbi:MAG: galactokinase [Planctomycetia bacterium]|jgi:galactokinase
MKRRDTQASQGAAGALEGRPAASELRDELLRRMRAARLERSASLRALAVRTGMSPTLLVLVEQGKRVPSTRLASEWVETLDLPSDLAQAFVAWARLHHGAPEERISAALVLDAWRRANLPAPRRSSIDEAVVVERFAAVHGARATHLVVAPGRVNLVGEHIDYNLLPVLPMAIDRAVVVAVRARDDRRLRAANLDPRHAPCEFELEASLAPATSSSWSSYLRAAALVVAGRLGEPCRGADLLFAGDVPEAAGLSSSSALLVATVLALLAARGVELPREELMELCAQGERHVGVQSGGMDQAICLGGRLDHAVKVGFAPLSLQPAPLPSAWRFVVAHSGVLAHKAGRARDAYNERVRECGEALSLLRVASGARADDDWRGLLRAHGVERLVALAERGLPPVLLRRARHVLHEAARVEQAVIAMACGDLSRFGATMDASHASLRDDYEVSCPELDELVQLARDHGAAGARLVGAGFGGCIVALCEERLATGLAEQLRDRWQEPRHLPASSVQVVRASEGAGTRRLASGA